MTRDCGKHYICGRWVEPASRQAISIVNPATERSSGRMACGDASDVDYAVKCARQAFGQFARVPRQERIALLEAILTEFDKRLNDFTAAISEEIGAPKWFARRVQVAAGRAHLTAALAALRSYPFLEYSQGSIIIKEPIGVCGLLTPSNWPINQIACKVAPALATGCTVVLKPSELAPFSCQVFAEVLDAAGVPKGVFNVVFGEGSRVGKAITLHPDIDMVSVTGSTDTGVEVAKSCAPSVKRVTQELGGKSAVIILDDERFETSVKEGARQSMLNAGQSCNAPSRMLVPMDRKQAAAEIAKATVDCMTVGGPDGLFDVGPVASKSQWDRVQDYIAYGIREGAKLTTGGSGRPEGIDRGYFVRPTVFSDVQNTMSIAKEEIFGPVLCIIPYISIEDAVEIANDTPYGVAAYISGCDLSRITELATRLRVGQVYVNNSAVDFTAPFGGFKKSGNGREWGSYGFDAYLELKAITGLPKHWIPVDPLPPATSMKTDLCR